MKKTKLTRSLLAACSIVALSAVMYGCVHSGDDPVAEPPPIDMDDDGVADADDAFPNDPTETADSDGDGVGDNADPDRDGDGVANADDAFPMDATETADADGDGVGDNADLDDDGDGVADADDAFPNDDTETVDSDGDGVGDNADAFPNDRDNDGVVDVADAFPDDPTETRDSDDDGVGNNADAFPLDGTETADSDMDGVGDNADALPNNPDETADSDMDGVGDNADAFPMNAMETADSDMDGTGDNADAFPNDATETADADMDGTGDNADAFPNDATETVDSDMDGVGDNADAFPNDDMETVDSDMDGVGDNADPFNVPNDRDNDGVADVADAFPDDPAETKDSDDDGVGNKADAFPFDGTETVDSDMDGVGDNADAFPNDAMETVDADGDGVGDNADDFPGDDDQRLGGRLVQVANAYGVEDVATTPTVDEQAQAVMTMAMAVNTAAGAADNGEASTAATATWPGVPDDPDTADTDESAMSVLSINVTPANTGGALTFRTEAVEDDPDTLADESMTMPQTATDIGGLGDFMNGFSISDGDRHVIVFTDKDQDDAPVTAVTALTASEHTNLTVDLSNHTITDLGSQSGRTYSGVTFYEGGNVDVTADNHDSGGAFMGTLTCPDGVACNIQTNADGEVTAITGYRFSGSRAARAAVTAMDPAAQAVANNDYLAFGVWPREDSNGNGAAGFGAFAAGGSTAEVDVEVTGTASYTGSATGVYTEGSAVDYFQGRAALTANFGAPGVGDDADVDDTEEGIITGTIDQIVAGGVSMSDVISLHSGHDRAVATDGNIGTNGAFMGSATMGDAMVDGTILTYTYNGTWSGQFYNGTADDGTTDDVDESQVAPGSVAGTFGVTGTMGEGDDAMTRSYLGAFGAHQDD